MKNKMFIPETISVGYNKRTDTYTGKLAYIIYTDQKGVLRKERSWESWRDKNLGRDDYSNVPTSGFVLNKGVGGARFSYGHNVRNEYVRVYDPRNFEFEISVHNLLFILQECSAIKGKGLEGEFVYAWNGTELVLLPIHCKEYKECLAYTELQGIDFDKKDMKEGFSYLMKNGTNVLYLGRFNYNKYNKDFYSCSGKKYIFVNLDVDKRTYIAETNIKIAKCTSVSALAEYPNEHDIFKNSVNFGNIKSFTLKKVYNSSYYDLLILKEDQGYSVAQRYYTNSYNDLIQVRKSKPFKLKIKDGLIKLPSPARTPVGEYINLKDAFYLYVETENGKELRVI